MRRGCRPTACRTQARTVDPATGTADLSLNLTKAQLLGLLGGGGLDGLDR